MILFDLERDHVNPAVRAVEKSEVEIEIVYCYLLSGKGVKLCCDGIITIEMMNDYALGKVQ